MPGGIMSKNIAGRILIWSCLIALSLPVFCRAEEPYPVASQAKVFDYQFRTGLEIGFLGVLDHSIQFGKSGTNFSYTQDGGQDNLYPITRFTADFSWNPRNTLIFLYQPLEINTSVVLTEDLKIYDQTFPTGTPMDLRYAFPFYRLSYLYNFSDKPEYELALGLSLQIRNATIEFRSQDGSLFSRNSNIGLVPLLKFRGRYTWANGYWIGSEIDGIYAPVSYLNGSDNEVVGALLDASLRAGITLPDHHEVFLNLRYLSGGATGTSTGPDAEGDGYVKNWLHFITLSLGFTLNWL
jgi:hypothetical protein